MKPFNLLIIRMVLMEQHGGRDAVIKRGDLGFTPPPGYPVNLG